MVACTIPRLTLEYDEDSGLDFHCPASLLLDADNQVHVHACTCVCIKVKLHVYMYVFKTLTFIATQVLVAMLIHSWKKINVDCVIISPL